MLEKAQAKKKRPGKRKKKDEDEISDEELAGSLEGWLEVSSSSCSIEFDAEMKSVWNAVSRLTG